VILTDPSDPAGEVQTMVESLTTVIPEAAFGPKVTLVAPVKKTPVMVTAVPPVTTPLAGDAELTTGTPV